MEEGKKEDKEGSVYKKQKVSSLKSLLKDIILI